MGELLWIGKDYGKDYGFSIKLPDTKNKKNRQTRLTAIKTRLLKKELQA